MIAAFHRDLISAPFNTRRPLFLQKATQAHSIEGQKTLREAAALVAGSSGFPMQQKVHLDENGLSLVWTAGHAQIARSDSVKVIFTGMLHNYEDICSLYAGCDKLAQLNNPADLLLHIYLQGLFTLTVRVQEFRDLYGDNTDQPSCLLDVMEGDFAFLLYDAGSRYTLVARKGAAPLYWGSDSGEGDTLLISSVPAYLSPFPPGCAFESQVNEEGEGDSRMFNFSRTPRQRGVDTVKRIDSKGHLCGLMFKSVSGQDLVQSALATAPDVY